MKKINLIEPPFSENRLSRIYDTVFEKCCDVVTALIYKIWDSIISDRTGGVLFSRKEECYDDERADAGAIQTLRKIDEIYMKND